MVKYGQIVRFNQLLMLHFLFSITYENDRQDKHVMFILLYLDFLRYVI